MIRLASSARAAIAGNGWLIGKLVFIAVLMAWTIFSYADVDWEFLYTKHYFMQRYYGGYAHAIVIDQKRPIVESLEGTPSLYHVFAFLDRADDRYIGTYNVDRLYTSGFLPSLVVRLTGGAIGLRTAIYIANYLYWLASVALSYWAAKAWFGSRNAAFAAAALAVTYPVYALILTSLKTQSAGALFVSCLALYR